MIYSNKISAWFKRAWIIITLLVVIITGACVLKYNQVRAAPFYNFEFTEDVILDIGTQETVFIASGSKADSVKISDNSLEVIGIHSGDSFQLKTSNHKILEVTPSGSTANLLLSGSDIVTTGHLKKWSINSSANISFVIGTPDVNYDYVVTVDGSEIPNGPFNSGSGSEISFNRTGSGATEVYRIVSSSDGCWHHNVWGWAWSENIGWVSFSCRNHHELGTGINYGVDINKDTGEFSGYAWADSVGWISFDSSDLQGCPDGNCQATLLGNRKISGWAKVLSNDEWILLSGNISDNLEYGVELTDSEFYGWAFGDETVGWMSFNCEDTGKCAQSPYKVETLFSFFPEVLNAESTVRYCDHYSYPQVATGVTVAFSWDYYSQEEKPQEKYEIQVSEFSDFPSNNRFEKVADLCSPSCMLNLENDSFWKNRLDWNTTYYWRVRVSDGERWSEWFASQFTIGRSHPSPYVILSYSPDKISSGEVIKFVPEKWDDEFGEMRTSQVYDGKSPSYSWTFESGNPETASTPVATTTFGEVGSWIATLRITDSSGYYCEKSESLNVKIPLPDWKESTPFGKSKIFMASIINAIKPL